MAAIGVFDSGVGGLSVLQALRAELPLEDFVYVADSGHAPYGERDAQHVIARAGVLTRYLLEQHQVKALVIACNTATAAAIHLLRAQYPQLPVVGVEPALKPAAQQSQTKRVGVLATRGTLESEKFRALLDAQTGQAEFICLPCDGLASAIEAGDAQQTAALCARYTAALGHFGTQGGEIDTLVLGCTHYPFARDLLQANVGTAVALLDSGAPVARQTRRVLAARNALKSEGVGLGRIQFYSSGAPDALERAVRRWLGLAAHAARL